MVRRVSVLVAILAVATFALPSDAQLRFDAPQAKVNWIDVTEAPTVKIHVSFLDRLLRPVSLKKVGKIEVLRHQDGRGRGDTIKVFKDRLPEDGGEGEVILYAKADQSRDVVIVAVGHQDGELRDGELGAHHQAALATFFKKLGPTDRVNVIWYHDRLLTYVLRKGKETELSDLAKERERCEEDALKGMERWGQPPAEPEEGEGGPTGPPCGLLEDYGKLEKIVKGVPYQGFFPRLLGFELPGCKVQRKHERIGTGLGGGASEEEDAAVGGAIDEAFRMLVQQGTPGQPKLLLILSDGKNGYLEAQSDCRLRYETDFKTAMKTFREGCRARGRGQYRCLQELGMSQQSKRLRAENESKLAKRLAGEQQRFRDERLKQWLALAAAADIHVYTVGYPNGLEHELARLEVLSLRTGGTFRQAQEPNDVQSMANDLLDELANQYVVVFDGGLQPGETGVYSLRLQVPGQGTVDTEPFSVVVPVAKGGIGYFVRAKVRWLENLVGSPWHIVIVVVVCLLAVLFVFLFLKLIVALVKKIFKKGTKQAAGAAKQARGGAAKAMKAGARGSLRG